MATKENSLIRHTLERTRRVSKSSVVLRMGARCPGKQKAGEQRGGVHVSSPCLDDGFIDQNCEQHKQISLARCANITVVVLGGKPGEAEQCFEDCTREDDDDGPYQNKEITEIQRFFDALH